MLTLKQGVDCKGLQPEMYFVAGYAERVFGEHGYDCEITAACDGQHNVGSLHSCGEALDIHNVNLSEIEKDHIFAKLKHLESYGFDVVDEHGGQTAKTTAPHFHIEYQPKAGERQAIFV